MELDAGLVPAADRRQVLDRLVASVRSAGTHITSGSVGLGPLFRALHAGGRDDVTYDMVVNPASPGYGHLVAGGHSTLAWRSWSARLARRTPRGRMPAPGVVHAPEESHVQQWLQYPCKSDVLEEDVLRRFEVEGVSVSLVLAQKQVFAIHDVCER